MEQTTPISFAHAGGWSDHKAEANDEASKKLSDYLRSVLTTPNLLVLAGSGTSLGKVKGPSMPDLWNKATTLKGFAEVKTAVRQPDEDQWIENFLSRCQAAKDFLAETESKKVTDFLTACEKAILTACTDFVNSADLEGHKTFLRRMARRRSKAPRLRLFTTNYDRCFEESASRLGMSVIDGFSFSMPRRYDPRFFGYDIIRRAKGTDEANDFVEGVIQIFKLHGSVDWDRTADGIVQKDRPEVPCLIYPSNSKYQQSYTQPHLEAMTQFQAALREPNTCLVTIGFGFNDDHLSSPILAALESNPSFKLLAVDVAAKSKSEGDQGMYRVLKDKIDQGESDVAMLNAEFGQFAELIPQLTALSPAEQLVRSVKQMTTKP